MLCTAKYCPILEKNKEQTCPQVACQYRTNPHAKIKLTSPAIENVAAMQDQLTSLLCEITRVAGLCCQATKKHCKDCGYCKNMAEQLAERGVTLYAWTPASHPPTPMVPVLVDYQSVVDKDRICQGIACINADGKWFWWEGTARDSLENEACAVEILRWTPIPVSQPHEDNPYHISYFDTLIDEEADTKTHYFKADRALLKDAFDYFCLSGVNCCIISIKFDETTGNLILPVMIAPAKIIHEVPLAQDWYEVDINQTDLDKILSYRP